MPSVTVNNVQINYIEQGAGDEAVVFVHGLTGSIGAWREVLVRLPTKYHAYALDQRGHGKSGRPGSYKLTELTEDIYAFSREVGIGCFTYVGQSMAGTLGLKLALDHPDVLRALILVAHWPVGEWMTTDVQAPVLAVTGSDDYPSAMRRIFASPEMARGFILQMLATPTSEEIVNELVNDAISTDPIAIGDCFTWMMSSGLEPFLGDISISTLVVAGAKDPISPDAQRCDANRITGGRFQIFENSGHYLPIQNPQKFVDLLTNFIKDIGKG